MSSTGNETTNIWKVNGNNYITLWQHWIPEESSPPILVCSCCEVLWQKLCQALITYCNKWIFTQRQIIREWDDVPNWMNKKKWILDAETLNTRWNNSDGFQARVKKRRSMGVAKKNFYRRLQINWEQDRLCISHQGSPTATWVN